MSPNTTKRHIVVMTGFARDEISFVVEIRTKMVALGSAISHLRFCEKSPNTGHEPRSSDRIGRQACNLLLQVSQPFLLIATAAEVCLGLFQ